MKYINFLLLQLFIFASIPANSQKPIVHDPVMIKQDSTYYLFCTGWGISMLSSNDMTNWKMEKPVFQSPPEWAVKEIPTYKGHTWAPDISYYNGNYYLFYSVSAFGKNTSCIGLVTNKTLHPNDSNYHWTDHGKIIQSIPGVTNWNAIDPNLVTDESGIPYLAFGSFWDGIKLVKLNQDRLSTAEDIASIPTIASRKKESSKDNPPAIDGNPTDAGGNSIEAPFIFKKGNYYYLLASIDYCCKGVNSNYKTIVGRSTNIKGPYIDKEGNSMAKGGGTIILTGNKDWPGVGHCGVYTFNSKDYIIFHAYDANDGGKPKLLIRELKWSSEGWPEVGLDN
jgi:arabinan endo-1,5-alpha-L-arabinosidase